MKSKRLIWNFEIIPLPRIALPNTPSITENEVHWESRYFWQENDIISLIGISEEILELSRYKIKHRKDKYYLVNDKSINLKVRNQRLLYKPLLHTTPRALAYGKKKKAFLDDKNPVPEFSHLTVRTLLDQIAEQGIVIDVVKEALIYQFPTTPNLKIELARLVIHDTIYFSLCFESKVLPWVEYLSRHVISAKQPCDYITFLKTCYVNSSSLR